MITNKQIATTLTKAATLLETKGWIKGESAQDVKGQGISARSKHAIKFCALGALTAVTRNPKQRWAAEEAVLTMLTPAWGNLADYNDHRFRQRKHVTSLFRKVAAKLKKGA